MSNGKRMIVFETSALLATLSIITDHYTHDPVALERLLKPVRAGARPLLDRVVIPDHVLYELTGILPICMAEMVKELTALKATGDAKALETRINMYALASPRGEVHDATGDQKSHVRLLLRFIANHPDCIAYTPTARAYCERLKADYAVLGGVGMLPSQREAQLSYRPTFADAFATMGKDFAHENLRVHAGQMMMMGFISEHNFNERMGKVESAQSKHQRFYLAVELLDKLVANGTVAKELVDEIKKKEGLVKVDKAKADSSQYVTAGMLYRFPELLEMALKTYEVITPSGVERTQLKGEALVKAALSPSHLLMEHYVFGGVIDNRVDVLVAAAKALGFTISEREASMGEKTIRDVLYQQGFWEVSPTLKQLQAIENACDAIGHAVPALKRFTAALPAAEQSMRRQFRAACDNPQKKALASQSELKIPHIGLAYEKVFGDALVNGSMLWPEMLALLQNTEAFTRSIDGYKATQNADILIRPHGDVKQAEILVAQKGFVGRTGTTVLRDFISHEPKTMSVDGTPRVYYKLSAEALIARARAGMSDRTVSSKLYRVFETLLYPAVKDDASHVRAQAGALLGEDRLVQLEKDFANRHARKSLAVQPPYNSMFAAMHTNSRILRKNLGEVATMEAALSLVRDAPSDDVWVINHDSDLTVNAARDLELEDSVVRQHAGLVPQVRGFNQDATGKRALHMVNSTQFLRSLHMLIGLEPQWIAEVVSAKPVIKNHISHSWATQIDASIRSGTQER